MKLLVVLFFCWSFFCAASIRAEMLSIKGDSVHLRNGPGKEYSVLCEYGSGFPVEVLEKKGNWLKVRDFEKDSGWIHKSLLVKSPQVIVTANKNKEGTVNIRKGPGSDQKIVGKAYYGVVFKVIRQQAGWIEVLHESGLSGWVSSRLLWGL